MRRLESDADYILAAVHLVSWGLQSLSYAGVPGQYLLYKYHSNYGVETFECWLLDEDEAAQILLTKHNSRDSIYRYVRRRNLLPRKIIAELIARELVNGG